MRNSRNTLFLLLEPILVSAGEVVLDDGRVDPVQPGLAHFLSIPSRYFETRHNTLDVSFPKKSKHFF